MAEMKTYKSKVKSSGPLPADARAKGGSGHMVGKTGAGTPKVAGTSGAAHGPASRGFAHGGSGHMVGKQKSKPVYPC